MKTKRSKGIFPGETLEQLKGLKVPTRFEMEIKKENIWFVHDSHNFKFPKQNNISPFLFSQ